MKYLRIVLLVLIVIGLGLLATYTFWVPKLVNVVLAAEGIPTHTIATNRFISHNLGIGFQYDGTPATYPDGGKDMTVKTIIKGNTVYVGTEPVTDGQWVRVFHKDPKQSLSDAILEQVLADYPSKTCQIHITSAGSSTATDHPLPANLLTENIQIAEIGYADSASLATDPSPIDTLYSEYMPKCNPKYDKTNGIRYFFYDTNHPDTFLFFNIGQSPILSAHASSSEKVPTWQDTIQILR